MADGRSSVGDVYQILLKLLKIGVRFVCSVRRIVLQLSSAWLWHATFRQAAERLIVAAQHQDNLKAGQWGEGVLRARTRPQHPN